MLRNRRFSLTPPISYRDIGSNGILMSGVLNPSLYPQGSVFDVLNMHFDKIGSATLRKGTTILGAQISAGNNILGIHQFLDEGTGTNDQLIAVVNTVAYYLSAGTWTSKRTTLTANKKARFTNFINSVFMVNGVDAMNTWDGNPANAFGTTNTVSAPAASFIDNFRSRVWAANTTANPSRITYSSIAASNGTILWTGSDSSFIDISPGDGEDITGIRKFSRALWVFKNNFMYPIYSINQTEPDPQIFVGTYSQESVELAKDGMYWHHPSGIYRMRRGENQPTEISKPINDIIENISRTFYGNINSWHDADHVYWSVGDITINGKTINNCVVRYTISSEIWTIYSHGQEIRVGASYDDGSNLLQVVGDIDGTIYTYNKGKTDNGTEFSYKLEIGPYTLSGLEAETKTIRKMAILHRKAQGVNIGYRVDDDAQDNISDLGQLEEEQTILESVDITGHKIFLNVYGISKGETFEIHGFEVLEWLNEGILS